MSNQHCWAYLQIEILYGLYLGMMDAFYHVNGGGVGVGGVGHTAKCVNEHIGVIAQETFTHLCWYMWFSYF